MHACQCTHASVWAVHARMRRCIHKLFEDDGEEEVDDEEAAELQTPSCT